MSSSGRLNSAPTSTSQRDRIPRPEKSGNVPQDQAETDWEVARKQKRKGKSKKKIVSQQGVRRHLERQHRGGNFRGQRQKRYS